MISEEELKGATENWQNSRKSYDELVDMLRSSLETYNMTELSKITGINRTTMYYWLFGREGKNGRNQSESS